MNKEKLKSLLLVLLIATSIVLTQRVWFHSPLQLSSSEASYVADETVLAQSRDQVLRPKQIVVGFGGGAENSHFSILSPPDLDRFWQEAKMILQDHFVSEPTVQVVSHADYKEARGGRSIELRFAEGFPTAFLSTLFDQQDNRVAATVNTIATILIPARYQGSVYIVDEPGDIYEFRLIRQDRNYEGDPGELLDSIPVNSYVKYYTLFSYVENDVLLPLTHQVNIPRIFTESEVDASSSQQMNRWAGRFFNENFDFVKTIQETGGTRIYMYGYGQQEVRINNQGRLEYTAETGNQSSSSVGKALDTALAFMGQNEGMNTALVLKKVQVIEQDSLRGYRFGFGYSLGDLPVRLSRSQDPLEIEVFGNSVRGYRTFIRRPMSLPEVLPERGILSPHRLIEDNFNLLLDELRMNREVEPDPVGQVPEEADPEESAEEINGEETEEIVENEEPAVAGEDLLRAIEEIQLIYLDREETHRRQVMIPVWRITIDQRVYDFDAHEGTRLQTLTTMGRDV